MKKIIICIFCVALSVFSFSTINAKEISSTNLLAYSSSSPSQDDIYARITAETWVKKNLKDPRSYERISWKASRAKDNYHTYVVYLKFRAKNSFGGYTISEAAVLIYNFKSYNEYCDGIIQ